MSFSKRSLFARGSFLPAPGGYGRTEAGARAFIAVKMLSVCGVGLLFLRLVSSVWHRTDASGTGDRTMLRTSDALELMKELQELEARLANEVIANEVQATFTCEGVGASLLEPPSGTIHPVSP